VWLCPLRGRRFEYARDVEILLQIAVSAVGGFVVAFVLSKGVRKWAKGFLEEIISIRVTTRGRIEKEIANRTAGDILPEQYPYFLLYFDPDDDDPNYWLELENIGDHAREVSVRSLDGDWIVREGRFIEEIWPDDVAKIELLRTMSERQNPFRTVSLFEDTLFEVKFLGAKGRRLKQKIPVVMKQEPDLGER